MSREILPDYETQFLFPRSLEDWVGADHPARYVREFVDALDINALGLTEEQLWSREDANGRPHYAVTLLLKVWLYAYMNGIRSSRRLERACRDLLPLVWLSGMHEPDHNTLWRFWTRYRKTIRQVFQQSVRVAMEENLVGMVLHAVDGTKIKSASSKRSGWYGPDLKKTLTQLEEKIDQLEAQIAAAGEQGDLPEDTLPKSLQNRQELRSKIKEALSRLDEVHRDNLHRLDPEARIMVGNGRKDFGYNAQAVVDESNGIIVAADASNDENDEHQLEPMIEQVKENTSEFAAITVADSGYHTAESLGAAEAIGVHVLVAMPVKEREAPAFHTMRFVYDAESDTVVCPQQQRLTRVGRKKHKDKPTPVTTYRCRVSGSCPVAKQCSRDPRGREIEISPHYDAIVRNRRHPDARALLIRRQSVVERAFAEIKETLGTRRWSFRGTEKVKTQWNMICAAMNLRRMFATAPG